ncbi:hypothetical protein [Pseudomonas sp. B22129]|uniref:hypothetical protein n=1 Tax=Pseudomonas sp. B22129 TaxID=3235111 RepID=UPI003783F586
MTGILGSNAAPILSNSVARQPEPKAESSAPAVAPPLGDARVTSNLDAALADTPEARATADAQLARPFAVALATRSFHTSMMPPDVEVPPQSTLGRWRTQLDSAFKSPRVLAWAAEQGLDTRSLTLDPSRGTLAGTVNGQAHTFSLADDSGWSDVSRTLLSIARVIAPKPGQVFSYPWPEAKVPLYTVGRFYGEPIDLSPAQARLHRQKLKNGTRFEFAPMAYTLQRSAQALTKQITGLGDDANHQALITALRSQVDDAKGTIDLSQVMIPIDLRSHRFATEQRRQVSVAQYLQSEGCTVPANSRDAHDLASALFFDLAHRVPGGDAGGVRHIARLLSDTDLRKMRGVVTRWKAQTVTDVPEAQAGAGAGSLLHRLISTLPEPTRKLIANNPASVLDALIRSPGAQGLGETIRKKLNLAESPTTAIESVSVAILQELDPASGQSCFNVAGYNLYQKGNAGASAAQIVKRFTAHLEHKVGVEAAPVAAQLLLSAVAPEFLAKDIPPLLVIGSHTWESFSTAVALIEKQASGAPVNMTFSQIMKYADAQLIVLEGESQLEIASINPLIAWGLANDVIEKKPNDVYTSEDVARSLRVLKEQKKELEGARVNLLKPVPTREELALAELKRVFPDLDPTAKTLRGFYDKSYVVSLLDVYMTEPYEPDMWVSRDKKVFPWEEIKRSLSKSPSINSTFSEVFESYKKSHAQAWAIQFKYQISLLPAAERERLQQSDVSFMELSRLFLGTELEPGLSLFPARVPRKPTVQELEDLKGRHGLLMKVQGRDGQVDYYSYFPGLGKLVKAEGVPGENASFDDSAYFGKRSKTREPGTYNIFSPFGEPNTEREPPGAIGNAKGAFFSGRNGSLANVVGQFFTKDYAGLKAEAAGETAIEKTTKTNQKINEFLLSLVPFYDGIKDAINGNVAGAIFNIGFDILGFLLPGAAAGSKALKAGKSVGNALRRSFFAGVGASIGVTDALDLPKHIKRGTVTGIKDARLLRQHADEVLPRLKGNYQSYDVTRFYKEGDIVKGAAVLETSGVLTPVVAIFRKGGWYTYSALTNTPFGPQLAQFGSLSALESLRPQPNVLDKTDLPTIGT